MIIRDVIIINPITIITSLPLLVFSLALLLSLLLLSFQGIFLFLRLSSLALLLSYHHSDIIIIINIIISVAIILIASIASIFRHPVVRHLLIRN